MVARVFSVAGAVCFAGSLAYGARAYVVHFADVAPPGTWWLPPVLVDVALFSLFALHHSLLARIGIKQRLVTYIDRGLERPLYVWVASALFFLCCWAWRPLPGVFFRWPDGLVPLAIGLQLTGAVVTVVAARRLDVLDLAGLRPVADGAAPRPLETGGLYRLVRHPIYLGWILLVGAIPTMTWTRAVFAGLSVAYLAVAVPFEERELVRTYGDAYRRYQRHVRSRLVPGVY